MSECDFPPIIASLTALYLGGSLIDAILSYEADIASEGCRAWPEAHRYGLYAGGLCRAVE